MKNALLRGIIIFGFSFGLVALSACAEQTETDPTLTEEPEVYSEPEIMDEPMMDDSTMADSTMMEEPMEEDHADGEGGM